MKIELVDSGYVLVPGIGGETMHELKNGISDTEIESWPDDYDFNEVLQRAIEKVAKMTATNPREVYLRNESYWSMEAYRFLVYGIKRV